jgi:DnaK suppressor protein
VTIEELSPNQVGELTQLLKQKRTELHSQLEGNRESAEPVTLDQQSVGRVSRIDAIQQQQMNVANREQSTLLLKSVTSALARIAAEEYGYCEDCGEAVGYARLHVQPQALRCLACQSALEQN